MINRSGPDTFEARLRSGGTSLYRPDLDIVRARPRKDTTPVRSVLVTEPRGPANRSLSQPMRTEDEHQP